MQHNYESCSYINFVLAKKALETSRTAIFSTLDVCTANLTVIPLTQKIQT